jgi:DNA-directed RNA polymerase specialized sigma24 family protein
MSRVKATHSTRRLEPEQLPQHLDRLRHENDLAYLMRTMRNTWLNMLGGRRTEATAIEESAMLLAYKDAATALRTREGTVRSRLFRARAHVARALEADSRIPAAGADVAPTAT